MPGINLPDTPSPCYEPDEDEPVTLPVEQPVEAPIPVQVPAPKEAV